MQDGFPHIGPGTERGDRKYSIDRVSTQAWAMFVDWPECILKLLRILLCSGGYFRKGPDKC